MISSTISPNNSSGKNFLAMASTLAKLISIIASVKYSKANTANTLKANEYLYTLYYLLLVLTVGNAPISVIGSVMGPFQLRNGGFHRPMG